MTSVPPCQVQQGNKSTKIFLQYGQGQSCYIRENTITIQGEEIISQDSLTGNTARVYNGTTTTAKCLPQRIFDSTYVCDDESCDYELCIWGCRQYDLLKDENNHTFGIEVKNIPYGHDNRCTT